MFLCLNTKVLKQNKCDECVILLITICYRLHFFFHQKECAAARRRPRENYT